MVSKPPPPPIDYQKVLEPQAEHQGVENADLGQPYGYRGALSRAAASGVPEAFGSGKTRAAKAPAPSQPESNATELSVAVAKPAQKASQTRRGGKTGGTVLPQYGERRPMMYHLFENEMVSISSLNVEAMRYFSFGSFFVGLFISVFLGNLFADGEVQRTVKIPVHWLLAIIPILGVICFGFGFWSLSTKKTLIDQIKRETVTP